MGLFTAIPIGLPIRQDRCDLFTLNLQPETMVADFCVSQRDDVEWWAVRVKIDSVILVRAVDEFVYSVEGAAANTGINRKDFAYTVVGGVFFQSLTEAVTLTYPDLIQYSFLSLSTCVDVIALGTPTFEMVELPKH